MIEHGLTATPLDRETRYEYDQAGRKTKETDPVGAVTTWEYDAAGNLVRLTDANGNETTYAYDSEGRLTFETRGDPVQTSDSPTLPTWKTTYDSIHLWVELSEAASGEWNVVRIVDLGVQD